MQVKCFDEETAKKELKKCPKIVQDYFKLIERSRDNWKNISEEAIKKLQNKPKPPESQRFKEGE